MSSYKSIGKGAPALRPFLINGRRGRTREELAELATQISAKRWPTSRPITYEMLTDYQSRLKTVPSDGKQLLSILAAHDIPLIDALRALEFWPDLRLCGAAPTRALEVISEACAACGIKIQVSAVDGKQVVLEIEE